MNFKNLLVPVDFSANSSNALRYAIQFAQYTGSKIIVFHSNYIPSVFPSSDLKAIHEQSEGRRLMMLEYTVDKVCKKFKLVKPVNITYLIKRETNVVKNILAAADEAKAGLIIMGTHGASGIKKAVMGSNTSAIIEKSDIPVLAIPTRHRFKKIQTVVYASDLENLSAEVKQLAPIAKSFESDIEILYLDYWKKGIDARKTKKINDVLESTTFKNIKFVHKKVSLKKSMAEYLADYTKRKKSSILVMFPQEQSLFEKLLLGSITKKLSFNLKNPLLSIRKG
jgi:nucleotide-binding universal stress UspA family protein